MTEASVFERKRNKTMTSINTTVVHCARRPFREIITSGDS